MMELTEAQKKWLWEQCGFKYLPKGSHDKFHRLAAIQYPDGCIYSAEPPIDLNSLFKYAVPKVKEKLKDEYLGFIDLMQIWLGDILSGKDPALALFWAIYKAFGGKQCAGLK